MGEGRIGSAGRSRTAHITPVSTAAARTAACDDFLRGVSPPPSAALRTRMDRALESFSDAQLQRMRDAGVRFWPGRDGLPPDIIEAGAAAPPPSSPGAYVAGARTLRYSPDMSTAALRHELGHAWDDVGGETRRLRLDDLPTAERRRAITRLDREVDTGRAFSSTRDRGLVDAFEDYRGSRRWTSDAREREAFDLGARAGYSTRSVEEFYAEGFSAFHGSAERAARMERNAPELFHRLAEDARDAGTLPTWIDPATLTVRE